MDLSGRKHVVDMIMSQAIPMHGRMIHGRDLSGELWQAAQTYDVHGRVSPCFVCIMVQAVKIDDLIARPSTQSTGRH
jgi:kynurenine 3-monooxygenase